MSRHADLDLMNRDRQRHVICPTRFQAAGDRLTDILQRLELSGALDTHPGMEGHSAITMPVFISFQRYGEASYLNLTGGYNPTSANL